jgi:carbon monoxide dehydrogenase subunit G
VTFTQRCNAPIAKAWDFLTDHANMPVYFDGVTKFAPNGPEKNCFGAKYDVTAKIGPSTFKTKVDTIEWELERSAVFISTKVLKTHIRYRFTAIDENTCEVELGVDVSVPGGRATSAILAPFIRSSLAKTSANITAQFNG